MVTSLAAQSATDNAKKVIEASKPVTKQDVLKMIPQFEIRPIFTRPHLDREVVIGTIGERGGGKSGSDAVICMVDFMIAGKGVVSNMRICCDIIIDDFTARRYGLTSGGAAHYESEELEKDALLKLDERYRGKALEIEEINVQYSNVRRIMANTNVDFNEVAQQLRKFKMPLIYNVIDEMFIDSQLRALTDIFIKTYDTAFDNESLAAKKQTGLDFHWRVYPMTGYLCGQQGKYEVTHKPIDPVFLHYAPWRGVMDTYRHQEKGVYTLSTRDRNKLLQGTVIATKHDENLEAELHEWSWLADIAIGLKNSGKRFLTPFELSQLVSVPVTKDLRARLRSYGIYFDRTRQGYIVEDYSIGERVRAVALK